MYEISIYFSTNPCSRYKVDIFSYHSKSAVEEDLKEIIKKYFEKYYNVEITLME